MKVVVKKILSFVILIFSKIYSYKVNYWFVIKINRFYTLWISNAFKKIGSEPSIFSPLYLYGGKYITIGNNFCCDQRLRLDAYDEFLGDKFTPEIIIGDNVNIQKDCHIGAINRIIIGNNVLIASKVYISDHSHGEITKDALQLPAALRRLWSKGEIIIQENVWIGEGVVVLPGVTIGKNSIIGANAVISKSIPENSVAAGNPARVIRTL